MSYYMSLQIKYILNATSSASGSRGGILITLHCDSVVPQGTILGPLLCSCHINDFPQHVKSQVRLFADDCLLYRSKPSPTKS